MTTTEKKYCEKWCMRNGDLSKCPYYTRNRACEKAQVYADAFFEGYEFAVERACGWLNEHAYSITGLTYYFKQAMLGIYYE